MKQLYLSLYIILFATAARGQYISTTAGNHTLGYTGDGGAATAAEIDPFYVHTDGMGHLYLGHSSEGVVRKVTGGIITTVAGNGTAWRTGDGGPATAAGIGAPYGICTDRTGNLFIGELDSVGAYVRKVTPAGIISTLAGNGTSTYTGDGPATATGFKLTDITADGAGNIYIGEGGVTAPACRIYKVSPAGMISVFAGTGTFGYTGDGGPATAANIADVEFVAADSAGNVYFSDQSHHVVRKINTAGIISTLAGGLTTHTGSGGPATAAGFVFPTGLAADNYGNVYIGDYGGYVSKVDTSGIIRDIAGSGLYGFSGDGGPATAADMTEIAGVTCNRTGDTIYFTDFDNEIIRRIAPPDPTLSVQVAHSVIAVSVSPNPGDGEFSVLVSSAWNEATEISVRNVQGDLVMKTKSNTNKPTRMRLEAPPGLYYVKVTTEHGSDAKRVVVN